MKYIQLTVSLKDRILFLFYSLISEKYLTRAPCPHYKPEIKSETIDKTRSEDNKKEEPVAMEVLFFDLAQNGQELIVGNGKKT
jgi:hypothetical protein